ncbi:hypothetical protein PK98_02945 [Croceibacterium mercuriale]|uniref:Uncharacterized protein n=1 Tax=Croceibacterium mercuriale TaxID=1572751 RepID=A0A0B2BW16_9SPHN|nr:hypothetical protein [Croceibacterium mercuriale]KHL25629.1 hypothetical protein PK98_02945 [Croceibacterium mercuriale]
MHRIVRLLLAIAVLWCGLHLSPAEADGGVWTEAGAVAHARSVDHAGDGHPQADLVHGCHNHCPVAPAVGSGPAIGTRHLVRVLLWALPTWALTSAAQAPPIEPPAA